MTFSSRLGRRHLLDVGLKVVFSVPQSGGRQFAGKSSSSAGGSIAPADNEPEIKKLPKIHL